MDSGDASQHPHCPSIARCVVKSLGQPPALPRTDLIWVLLSVLGPSRGFHKSYSWISLWFWCDNFGAPANHGVPRGANSTLQKCGTHSTLFATLTPPLMKRASFANCRIIVLRRFCDIKRNLLVHPVNKFYKFKPKEKRCDLHVNQSVRHKRVKNSCRFASDIDLCL